MDIISPLSQRPFGPRVREDHGGLLRIGADQREGECAPSEEQSVLPPKHVLFLIHCLYTCQCLKLYCSRSLFELIPNNSMAILGEVILHRVLTGLGSGAIFATDFV